MQSMLCCLCRDIREQLAGNIDAMQKVVADYQPHLAIVQVGNRADSNVYIKHKLIAAREVGIKCTHVNLPPNTTESQVYLHVLKLTNN